MNMIFNTANPVMILIYTIIVTTIIVISRKLENPIFSVLIILYMLILLIFHSTEKITIDYTQKIKFLAIAFDLIFLFLGFISFLWIDDINAKKKNLKSYDNSLAWFWDEL